MVCIQGSFLSLGVTYGMMLAYPIIPHPPPPPTQQPHIIPCGRWSNKQFPGLATHTPILSTCMYGLKPCHIHVYMCNTVHSYTAPTL